MNELTRYERLLLSVNPQRAYKRYEARMRLATAQRAFENVDTTRLRKKHQDMRSPDQINALSTEKLRFQGRYLEENYDIAKSVLDTLVASVVGEMIHSFPMMRLENGDLAEDTNIELARLWKAWGRRPEATRELSWAECQQVAARSWFRDGEMFNQSLMGNVPGIKHETDVALSIELTEADFCPIGLFDDGNSPGVADGNYVRQGVEKSREWNKPEAYWFWKVYPTEIGSQFSATIIATPISQMLSLNERNLNRVPAVNISHLKMTDRIKQTRGNTIFASVYSRMMDLKDYEESERVAARIGAAFAFAITKGIDTMGSAPVSGDRWREMDIAPGIIADNLAAGEKVESLKNERPSNLIKDFRTTQLQSVAGGTGANFSSISKQYDGSYSSQRQELMESYQNYRTIRARFTSSYIDPIWRDFVVLAVTQGLVNVQGVDPRSVFEVEHLGSGVPYIDPKREVEADEKRVAAGFRSRHQTILDRGDDPKATYELLLEETRKDEENDITFTTSPIKKPEPAPAATGLPVSQVGNIPADEAVDDEGMLIENESRYLVGRRYQGPEKKVYLYTVNGFVLEGQG